MENELKAIVYHGRDNHDKFEDGAVFFSSSQTFASDYGEVKLYELNINNPFHTGSEEHINSLLTVIDTLSDGYSGEEYKTYNDLIQSGLLYHDTWEVFEPHINKIEKLGFEGMIIYEGGIENYISFHSNQYTLLELSK